MSLPNSRLVLAGCLALGFVLGSAVSVFLSPPSKGPMGSSSGAPGNGKVLEGEVAAGRYRGERPDLAANRAEGIEALDDRLRSLASITSERERTFRIMEWSRQLSPAECEAAFRAAKKLPRRSSLDLLAALGRRWAEVDPAGAAAFGLAARKDDPPTSYSPFLDGVIEQWSRANPERAMAWLRAQPAGFQQRGMLNTLAKTVAETDPASALKLLQLVPNPQASDLVETIFEDWASKDPPAAAAAATAYRNTDNRNFNALSQVASSWADADPKAALAWAQGLSSDMEREAATRAAALQWASADPPAFFAWARNLPDAAQRASLLGSGLSILAESDLPTVMEQIQSMPDSVERDHAVEATAQGLASSNALAAAQLLDQIPASPERSTSLARVCELWAASDPGAAFDWLAQRATIPHTLGLTEAFGNWMQTSQTDALAWAQALPAGESRDRVMGWGVDSLAQSDLPSAERLFAQLSPQAQQTAVVSITAALGSQGLDQALAWASSLPASDARDNAFWNVAKQWAQSDPGAGAKWLNTLPAGSARDGAINGFSTALFPSAPADAIAWAASISDPEERDHRIMGFALQWLGSDETRARQWIADSSALTAQQRARLLGH
jgi:hypothetical protein